MVFYLPYIGFPCMGFPLADLPLTVLPLRKTYVRFGNNRTKYLE